MEIYIILGKTERGEYACFWEAHKTFQGAENSVLDTYEDWKRAYPDAEVHKESEGGKTTYSLVRGEDDILSSCQITVEHLFND